MRIPVVALLIACYASKLLADASASAAEKLVLKKAGAERTLPERIMKEYCDALRPYFPPDAKVAVQAAGAQFWPDGSPSSSGGARLRQWDAELKPADWFDAVTVHPYPRIDQIMGVPGAIAGWHQPQQAMKLFKALLAHCDQGIDNVIDDVRQRLPGKEIWVTEWSTRAVEFNHPEEPSAAMHIQLTSRMILAFLRHREVTMSLFYTLNFIRHGDPIFQADGHDAYRPELLGRATGAQSLGIARRQAAAADRGAVHARPQQAAADRDAADSSARYEPSNHTARLFLDSRDLAGLTSPTVSYFNSL